MLKRKSNNGMCKIDTMSNYHKLAYDFPRKHNSRNMLEDKSATALFNEVYTTDENVKTHSNAHRDEKDDFRKDLFHRFNENYVF